MLNQAEMIPKELAAGLDLHEAASWSDYFASASPEVAQQCGLRLEKIGGAYVTIAANIDMLAMNRVIGLGLGEPASEASLDRIVSLYREAGVPRFFVQVSPNARPDVLSDWLEARGFRHHNNWVKFFREVGSPLPVTSDLRIAQIGPEQAEQFAHIIVRSFEWPDILRTLIAIPVGHSGWRHYLAYDGEQAVACAAAYFRKPFAEMAFAATLPEYRGRGAQSAFLARRMQDAAELGCEWLITETAEDTPDRPVASYRNMRRFGFEVAYLRPNYLLEFHSNQNIEG